MESGLPTSACRINVHSGHSEPRDVATRRRAAADTGSAAALGTTRNLCQAGLRPFAPPVGRSRRHWNKNAPLGQSGASQGDELVAGAASTASAARAATSLPATTATGAVGAWTS